MTTLELARRVCHPITDTSLLAQCDELVKLQMALYPKPAYVVAGSGLALSPNLRRR